VVVDVADPTEPPAGWSSERADVRDEEQVREAIDAAAARLGGIDAVIAAAGVVPAWRPLEQLDLDEYDRVMAINARGIAATLKHAAPHLGIGATVVIVASLNSWRGDPNIAAYVASKHAALGLMRAAALSLGPRGVRVNAVGPGPIATDALLGRMRSRAAGTGMSVDEALAAAAGGTALGRLATVAEVVDAMLFLSSGLSSGLTGQLLNVDAGLL
jgi:NAD(P)-dependent dehydrogenase (short-subunit alcohol dehydrogenase family)